MAEGEEPSVRLGRYVGRKSDHSCPGDHVTWEIVLAEGGQCTIECRSELSPSKGGTQAWHVEGTWEEDDDEVVVSITKEDPLGGPRSDRDVTLQVDDDVLTFKGAKCQWTSPPPDHFLDAMAALSLKELKAKALSFGLDPTGCIEREEQLDELPPIYLAVSGSEVLTGDSMIFAQRAAVRGVRVYISMFPGMWHGFPQYIEGCGSGTELWQGTTALSHAGDFVSQITSYLRSRPNLHRLPQSGEKTPRTNVYYPNPEGAKPWSFVGELNLGLVSQVMPPEAVAPPPPPSKSFRAREAPKSFADDDQNSELSLVPPRALPKDVVINCPQDTMTGAVMSGMLLGSLCMVGCLTGAAWYLSRRAHGELPAFCPDFLQHPLENYKSEVRS